MTITNDLLYQLALTQIPNIGHVHAKLLTEHFDSAEAIFRAPMRQLEKMEGIGTIRARSIVGFRDFKEAEKEIKFMEKYKVTPLFLTDEGYPERLLECYDPPTLLFYKGTADLNAAKMIAVIGTRSNTAYGRKVTEELVKELTEALKEELQGSTKDELKKESQEDLKEGLEVELAAGLKGRHSAGKTKRPGKRRETAHRTPCIVSGLAFGIDAIAHRAAMKNGLPTVGVLAHGMGTIYPKEHAALAKEMLHEGGILTEFSSRKQPDRHHFPTRNRIVAGCCDAVIVVETGSKGGSLITAELANGYHRDVFAVPGRITDPKSAGCNQLIQQNKAISFGSVEQLLECMGWKTTKKKTVEQARLFQVLSEPETVIMSILENRESVHMEEISLKSSLGHGMLAGALLNLELQQLIEAMPGKMYKLK